MVQKVTPEMCGKVIDESHFKFHVTCKAKVLHALNKMKNGIDFLKALSKTNFSTDKRWTQNSCNDPNVKVLMEILEEYKKREHRPTRAKILIPLIEYAIGLYASDLFYRERGEWFIYELIRRSPDMRFASVFIDPNNWYPLSRNSGEVQGVEGSHYKMENAADYPCIEQEYLQWYGIDVTRESIDDLPPELVEKIIEENKQWMEAQKFAFPPR